MMLHVKFQVYWSITELLIGPDSSRKFLIRGPLMVPPNERSYSNMLAIVKFTLIARAPNPS